MPLWKQYRKAMGKFNKADECWNLCYFLFPSDSHLADLNNTSSSGGGGSCTAAAFLKVRTSYLIPHVLLFKNCLYEHRYILYRNSLKHHIGCIWISPELAEWLVIPKFRTCRKVSNWLLLPVIHNLSLLFICAGMSGRPTRTLIEFLSRIKTSNIIWNFPNWC